jgi:hypothetical protein
MNMRPSDKHSIDRINNNGDYCKENCRWATNEEQANNKRNNKIIEYNNKKTSLSEFCKIYNVSRSRVRKIINNTSQDKIQEELLKLILQ